MKYQVNLSTSNTIGGVNNDSLNTGNTIIVQNSEIVTGGSSNFYLDLSSTNTNITPNLPYALTPGTHYYWQVRAYFASGDTNSNPADDNVGWSPWSSVADFVTNGSGSPIQPIANYPIDTVTIYTTAPTLFWHLTDTGAGLTYVVQISTSPTFADTVWADTTLTQNVFNTSEVPPPSLNPGTTYYWRVKSINGSGATSAWSENTPIDTAVFTVAGGVTNSYPILSWPIGSPTLFTTQPTLLWYLEGPSLGVSGYVVKYKSTSAPADWSTFSPASNDTSGGDTTLTGYTNTSYQIWNILPYTGHYYWAVATIEGSGSNANYSQDDFYIGATSGAPVQSQPSDGATVYSDTVTISWYLNGPTNGIQDYNIQYSNSDVYTPFTSAVVDTQSLTLTGLTIGATYYWRVQAHYNDGSLSNWSSWWAFNIQVGSPKVVQPLVGGPNNVSVSTASPMFSWFLPTQANSGLKFENC